MDLIDALLRATIMLCVAVEAVAIIGLYLDRAR
jgi:hypothetical protein